jgi:acetyl esterase/lipase
MIDWTDAFDNSSYVAGSDRLPALWSERAAAYRDGLAARGLADLGLPYGAGEPNAFDLFWPQGEAQGLVVFVHGGYWQRMDRSFFSHLAEGARSRGWAVAMPSYTLAPEARISRITRDTADAVVAAADRVSGPVRLTGHSAGGHLVSRMACADGPLPDAVAERLESVLSISGIHDLRPLLLSEMNEVLHLTEEEAAAESPALHAPRAGLPIRFHVGAAERPELLRQTRLIAEAWGRKGGDVADAYLPGEDHFTIVEKLADPDSRLLAALLG